MQTVDKIVISGLRWYASDQYRLLITGGGVDGVGGDFSQTALANLEVSLGIGHIKGMNQDDDCNPLWSGVAQCS